MASPLLAHEPPGRDTRVDERIGATRYEWQIDAPLFLVGAPLAKIAPEIDGLDFMNACSVPSVSARERAGQITGTALDPSAGRFRGDFRDAAQPGMVGGGVRHGIPDHLFLRYEAKRRLHGFAFERRRARELARLNSDVQRCIGYFPPPPQIVGRTSP